jgi:hypothetical protein
MDEVCRMSNYLRSAGVKKGDAVSIYMPMVCELPIAMLACARIGAVHSVVFGGFSSEALAGEYPACCASLSAAGAAALCWGDIGLPFPALDQPTAGLQPTQPPQAASPTARPRC